MQEFTGNLTTAFRNGLTPAKRAHRGQLSLLEARGVQVSPFGLDPFEAPINVLPLASIDWPFPQVLKLQEEMLVGRRNSLSRLTPGLWNEAPISVRNPLGGGVTNIAPGGYWNAADLPSTWFAFNGESTVFTTGLDSNVYCDSTVRLTDGCAHRGRILVGGFKGNVWNSSWQAVFAAWREDAPEELTLGAAELDERFVLWSSIGGGDFPLWLFFPSDHAFFSPGAEDLIARMKRNEWGFMPLPVGKIVALRPLAEKVIVYGTEGIAALVLVNGTYGMRKLLAIGVADRAAIASGSGEDQAHQFIAADGTLWGIGADLSVSPIGYQPFLGTLLNGTPVLQRSAVDGRLFCSSEEACFLLASKGEGLGLTEGNVKVASLFQYQGADYGIVQPYEDGSVLLVSSPFDLGIRGNKTINMVTLAMEGSGLTSVALDYRYDSNSSWQRSKFAVLNKEGAAHLRVTALEFRLVITSTSANTFLLDDVQIKYQLSDKRTIRGPLSQLGQDDF